MNFIGRSVSDWKAFCRAKLFGEGYLTYRWQSLWIWGDVQYSSPNKIERRVIGNDVNFLNNHQRNDK
jgi:hypothetical protein